MGQESGWRLKSKRLDRSIEIRAQATGKDGFDKAAALAAMSLSSRVRQRLGLAPIRESEGSGRRVPLAPEIPFGGSRESGLAGDSCIRYLHSAINSLSITVKDVRPTGGV